MIVAKTPCATAFRAMATAWLNVAHTYSMSLKRTVYTFYSSPIKCARSCVLVVSVAEFFNLCSICGVIIGFLELGDASERETVLALTFAAY